MITKAQTQVIHFNESGKYNFRAELFFPDVTPCLQLLWLYCLVLTTKRSSEWMSKDFRMKTIQFLQGEGHKKHSMFQTTYFHCQKHY